MQKKSCVNLPICYTTTMKEKIEIGDFVIVGSQVVCVDTAEDAGMFWGTTDDGEEVGFYRDNITAKCP